MSLLLKLRADIALSFFRLVEALPAMKPLEQRMRLVGARFELRMILHADEERPVRQLHGLDQPSVGRKTREGQPRVGQRPAGSRC